MAFWFNVVALCSGMAGTALISSLGELVGEQQVARIKRFRRLGNTGLVLLFLAFLLQLVALLITKN